MGRGRCTERGMGHNFLMQAITGVRVVVVDCSQGGEEGAWIIVVECRLQQVRGLLLFIAAKEERQEHGS